MLTSTELPPKPAEVHKEKPPSKDLEHQIKSAEKALGIETDYDRLMEASLFIDKKFISYALITGVTPQPERIFGADAWADYLDARVLARQYGSQDLTPNFIIQLHEKLTQRSNSGISGKIRTGGVIGASYDVQGEAVSYTQEQVKAIESNPLLKFQKVPEEDSTSTTGFIVYPHGGSDTQELVRKDLQDLCTWFNEEKNDPKKAHATAALLQHKLISLHPFSDSNGTLSRLLMNWSLENNGIPPSAVSDPTEDILIDEQTWISRVAEGSANFAAARKRQVALLEAGIDNINALFDLGQDKAFYEYIFKHLSSAPPLPTNGDKHNHKLYETFLSRFKTEMDVFQKYMATTAVIQTADGSREISQGGLISPESIQFASTNQPPTFSPELRNQFFSDIEVYRGGMIEGEVNDEKVLAMFQGFTGVGTGYRALERSHMAATSQQQIHPQAIQESLAYYNSMIASSYMHQKHVELPNPYATSILQVKDLATTIKDHIAGGKAIWNSPFASTSMDHYTASSWAKHFSSSYANNSRHGVVFTTIVPREGIIMTFGDKKIPGIGSSQVGFTFEREVLIAGGLQPASITQIEIYDQSGSIGSPSLRAKKADTQDGQATIVIEDQRQEFIVRRTYTYDSSTSRFALTQTEQTEERSTREREMLPIKPLEESLFQYLPQIKKPYESEFFIKYKESSIYQDYQLSSFISEKTNYFNKEISILKQPVFENEYFINNPLNENLISFKNIYKIKPIEENQIFEKLINIYDEFDPDKKKKKSK